MSAVPQSSPPTADRSLYYEDLTPGRTLESSARTVTETDLITFCMISGDWNPMHSDIEASRRGDFGQRVVHGLFGITLLTGLMEYEGWFRHSIVAMLGIHDWRFLHPIVVGVTLSCRLEITTRRLSRKPDRGIVGRQFELIDRTGDVLQRGTMPAMIRLRFPSS